MGTTRRVRLDDTSSLYLRGRVWWLDAIVRGYRIRKSLDTSDLTRAALLARDLLTQADPVNAVRTIAQAFDKYLEEYSKLHHRPNTARRYRQVMAEFIRRVGADLHPSQIIRRHVLDYQRERAATCSPETVNGDIGHIRAFCNWCRAEGMLDHDPCFKVKRIKVNRTMRRTLTPEQFEKVLETVRIDPFVHDYVVVAANTGMRPNEILHVRGCDLDVTGKALHIRAWRDWRTKDAEDRILVLCEEALSVLARRKIAAGDDSRPVFAGKTGGVRNDRSFFHRFRRKLPKEFPSVGLYEFRHYFASETVKRKMRAEDLRLYMGHAELSTTLRYYMHVRAEQVGAPPTIATG